MTEDLLSDWFHQAALAVGFVAAAEGWLGDAERVKRTVYAVYESGEWPPDSLPPTRVTTPPDPAKRFTHPHEMEEL
ncbi:MAG: hypothetical protein U0871_04590 [Gemmataceae bacterium]